MDKIQLTLTIDPANTDQMDKLKSLLDSISGNSCASPQPKVEKPAKKTTPKQVVKEPEVEENQIEETDDVKTVDIDTIRNLLAKKVGDNRPVIKAKLTEMGAKNVSSLDESHYADFYTFLESL